MKFSEILEAKMRNIERENQDPTSANPLSDFNILHLEPEFQGESYRFEVSKIPYSTMPKTPRKAVKSPPEKAPPPEPKIRLEKLPIEAILAHEIFLKLGAIELEKSEFSLSEVKKSYRRLAKIYHPDRCKEPQTDKFQRLSEAFQCLKKAA